jgi:hypothetical protein
MKNKYIIAIGGFARSGKDTCCRALLETAPEDIKGRRIAFADILKNEVDEFLIKETGISAWTDNPKEKEIIRPFLVFWGTDFRRQYNPEYWIQKVDKVIEDDNQHNMFIITDLRFPNELEWVKKNGGVSCVLRRMGIEAPNSTEEINNAELLKQVDYIFNWPDLTADEIKHHVKTTIWPLLYAKH